MTTVAVRPSRVAIGAGVLAALYVLALVATEPVPTRVLGWLGGPRDAFERQGGLSMTWDPPPAVDRDALERRFAERQHGADLTRAGDGYRVRVPGIARDDVDRTARRIGGSARLEFHEVIDGDARGAIGQLAELLGLMQPTRRPVDVDVDQWTDEVVGRHVDYYLHGPTREAIAAKLAEAAALGWSLPAGSHIAYAHEEGRTSGGVWRTYVIADRVAVDGASIANATGAYDPNTNRPIVLVDLDRDGGQKLEALTERLVGRKLAIVVDGDVRMAPMINSKIAGGRVSINLGGDDPLHAERERDELVTTLAAGALPAGGRVSDVDYVAPVSGESRAWLARLGTTIAGALVAALAAWAAVRWLKPVRRRVPWIAGGTPMWTRLVWTALGLFLLFIGTQITLPNVNGVELTHVVGRGASGGGGWHELTQVSVFALGLGPLLTSFVAIELAVSIVPRWRRLRDGGPEGRRKIARAVAIAAVLVAALQGYFISRYLEALDRGGAQLFVPGLRNRLLIVVTLAAATAAIAWIVSWIGSRGIGNGYAVVLLASWFFQLPIDAMHGAPLVLGLATIAGVAAIVIVVTGWRIGREGAVGIPIPSSALIPMSDAAGLGAVVIALSALGVTAVQLHAASWFDRASGLLPTVALIAIGTALWSFVFARPGRRRRELARFDLAPPSVGSWLRATALSAFVLLAIYAITRVVDTSTPELHALVEPTSLVLAIVVASDLIDELRTRHRDLVPIWPLHDVLLVDAVSDRLTALGIPHYMQASRLRRWLGLFGAYAPVVVFVSSGQAVEAERALRDHLVESGRVGMA